MLFFSSVLWKTEAGLELQTGITVPKNTEVFLLCFVIKKKKAEILGFWRQDEACKINNRTYILFFTVYRQQPLSFTFTKYKKFRNGNTVKPPLNGDYKQTTIRRKKATVTCLFLKSLAIRTYTQILTSRVSFKLLVVSPVHMVSNTSHLVDDDGLKATTIKVHL